MALALLLLLLVVVVVRWWLRSFLAQRRRRRRLWQRRTREWPWLPFRRSERLPWREKWLGQAGGRGRECEGGLSGLWCGAWARAGSSSPRTRSMSGEM